MKKALYLILVATMLSCSGSDSAKTNSEDQNKVETFLYDFENLEKQEKVPSDEVMNNFRNTLSAIADMEESLGKENIKSFLERAKNYKHCVIIVGDHTIVKVEDLDDCKQSGSWGSCMPMGEGYIRKGEWVSQKDYINNIIGLPDARERIGYLFND